MESMHVKHQGVYCEEKITKANNKQLVLQMSAMNQLWVESSRRLLSQQTHFRSVTGKFPLRDQPKHKFLGMEHIQLKPRALNGHVLNPLISFSQSTFLQDIGNDVSLWSLSSIHGVHLNNKNNNKKNIIWASFFIV